MHSWWSAPLGNVRVLLVCFAGMAFSSLETWPVSELKVASGKPKHKHCNKRISQEQEEMENSKKSRPFKQMPPGHGRGPVFLLSPGINTRGTTLPPCWIYSMLRGLVSANQTFFASEARDKGNQIAHVRKSRGSLGITNMAANRERASTFGSKERLLSTLIKIFQRIWSVKCKK